MLDLSYISVKTEMSDEIEMKVLVLGGTGFIGRHVVRALRQSGHEIVIGTRAPTGSLKRLPEDLRGTPSLETHLERLLTPQAWRPLVAGFDIVVNCVGILRPRWGETYDRVHRVAPAALADACTSAGIGRLVHVSALGLDEESASGFIRSKHAGERELLRRRLDAVIVRPSLLDGAGGFGACWLRQVARWPVHFVPAGAKHIAPLDVEDLALAIAKLCEAPPRAEVRVVELGGADTRTMREHLAALRRLAHGRPAHVIEVPTVLARLVSHVCDLLHVTPFSFGHLLLMRRDNVPARNELAELLGRAPRAVGLARAGWSRSAPELRSAARALP